MSDLITAPPIPSTDLKRAPIGIAKSFIPMAVFFIAIIVYYIGEFAVTRALGIKVTTSTSLLLSFIVAWPPAFGVATVLSGKTLRECLPNSRVPLRIWAALAFTVIGMVPVLASLITFIPIPAVIREAFEKIGASNKASMFLSVVIIAPIAEEFFFRGILLQNFLHRYSRTKAIWATAILFAFFHANPWQAVAALPLGLLFAWIVVETQTIWTSVFAHFMSNFVATFAIAVTLRGLGYSDVQIKQMNYYPASLSIGALAVMAVGLVWLSRAVRQHRSTAVQKLTATTQG